MWATGVMGTDTSNAHCSGTEGVASRPERRMIWDSGGEDPTARDVDD